LIAGGYRHICSSERIINILNTTHRTKTGTIKKGKFCDMFYYELWPCDGVWCPDGHKSHPQIKFIVYGLKELFWIQSLNF
jgi:hypothetical protein